MNYVFIICISLLFANFSNKILEYTACISGNYIQKMDDIVVNPLSDNELNNESGELYSLYNSKEETIMEFNETEKNGKIKINNTIVKLKSMSRDDYKFEFYGDGLKITCQYPIWPEDEDGGDCSYAKVRIVNIEYQNNSIGMPNIDLRYCLIGDF